MITHQGEQRQATCILVACSAGQSLGKSSVRQYSRMTPSGAHAGCRKCPPTKRFSADPLGFRRRSSELSLAHWEHRMIFFHHPSVYPPVSSLSLSLSLSCQTLASCTSESWRPKASGPMLYCTALWDRIIMAQTRSCFSWPFSGVMAIGRD